LAGVEAGRIAPSMKVRNLFGLYAVQFTNTVLPLLTVPFLARTLGVEGFGTLSWIFAVSFVLVLATDCGINSVALRALAKHRSSARSMQRIFSATQTIRLSLACTAALVLAIVVACVPSWQPYRLLFAVSILNVMGTLAFPVFYYVATEASHRTALLHALGRGLSVVGTFIFVRSSDDVGIALALQCSATLLSGILAHLAPGAVRLPAYGKFDGRQCVALVKRARAFYLVEFQVQAMTSIPVLMLGALYGNATAGLYAACDKIARAAAAVFQPLLQALLPKWANELVVDASANVGVFQDRALRNMAVLAVLAGAVLFVGAPLWLDWVVGGKFTGAHENGAQILRMLSIWTTLHVVLRCMELRAFVARGRAHDFWVATRWVLVVQWVLLIGAAIYFGAVGAAAAIAFCEAIFVWRIGLAARRSPK
jgi:O-antigen/teichoic acid export membrane protein